MAHIAQLRTAVPERYPQADIRAAASRIFGESRYLSIFEHAGVETRHLVRPPAAYIEEATFESRNREAVAHTLELAAKAAEGLGRGVETLLFVTTTSLATPSIDSMLVKRLGLDPAVRRVPMFGIGCAGGAAGLARAAELADRGPVLLIASEVCSLTFIPTDRSPTNVVAAALFADGAAAARIEPCGPGPRVIKSASRLFPNSERVMGWDFTDAGLKLVLSTEVPRMVREHLAPMIRGFIEDRRIDHWILHPGGPRVLDAYGEALGIGEPQLAPSRSFLARYGNLSSASVLFILSEVRAKPGDVGLVASVGPGFAGELVLLEW